MSGDLRARILITSKAGLSELATLRLIRAGISLVGSEPYRSSLLEEVDVIRLVICRYNGLVLHYRHTLSTDWNRSLLSNQLHPVRDARLFRSTIIPCITGILNYFRILAVTRVLTVPLYERPGKFPRLGKFSSFFLHYIRA